MKAIRPRRPNCLEFRETLHLERAAFATVAIGLGFAMYAARLFDPTTAQGRGMMGGLADLVRSGGLIVVGILSLFDRNQLFVDKTAGTLMHRWGFPLSLFTKRTPFCNARAVVLRHHFGVLRRTDFTHTIDIEVEDAPAIEVTGSEDDVHDELKSRHVAETLARLLGVEMIEHLREGDIHRASDALNRSVRTRLSMSPARPAVRSRALFVVQERAEGLSIHIRGPSLFTWSMGVTALLATALTAFFALDIVPDLFRSSPANRTMVVGVAGVLYAITMIPLLGALFDRLRLALAGCDVTAGSTGLRIERGRWWPRSDFIATNQLKDLRLESDDMLLLAAVSDRRVVRFGRGLSREELTWIRDQLLVGLGRLAA